MLLEEPQVGEQERQRRPGPLIRDARERRGWSLRYLAALLMMPEVELGEYERNVDVVPPAKWEDLRRVLGDLLPEVVPAQTAPKSRASVDKALHPTGRCTCGPDGGPICQWCECDERRTKREERYARRTARLQDDAPRDLLSAHIIEQERKRARRKAKSRQKARRGW